MVIVGAGPAGLSAALILGRACRKVLICDSGTPRSWASKRMHAYLTRDGIVPARFREIAHRELRRYRNVAFKAAEVTRAVRLPGGGFRLWMDDSRRVQCRKLLIATGLFDRLPRLRRIEEFFGISVFQCPYCDGWELRGKPLAVYGKRHRGLEMSRALTAWTGDIVLCTDGPAGFSRTIRDELGRNGIGLCEERIETLEGTRGRLRAVVFKSGRKLPRAALFFDTPSSGQSRLAESLGCEFTRHGGIKSGRYEATSVPGVFVAGNIIKDVQLSVVAAAEGARAAFGINKALSREKFQERATGAKSIVHPAPGSARK
ncbi:MAG TPA: NAD(P)/FAD-dependent oxidoreductase [Burkholderiales bacterium]|nr:NAD(P)/FAD-dependent oxidoreductase [Burkholderiales bacterium]